MQGPRSRESTVQGVHGPGSTVHGPGTSAPSDAVHARASSPEDFCGGRWAGVERVVLAWVRVRVRVRVSVGVRVRVRVRVGGLFAAAGGLGLSGSFSPGGMHMHAACGLGGATASS